MVNINELNVRSKKLAAWFAFFTTKQVDRGVVDTIANSDELAAF